MDDNYFSYLENLLAKNPDYLVEDVLNKNRVAELAHKYDGGLIDLLASDERLRALFFVETEKGVLVFNKDKFIQFISNKQFLPDSYTAYKNKVGLATDVNELLSERKEVVLNWPYKDAILEGGQDKDDAKRDEIFHNEILAPDQIDRLLDDKVLTGFKRYDKHGEHPVKEIIDDENLIIRGNNLLTLHSLKARYAGKVKLVYIDPPYNPDSPSNTFIYNNRFNHSTWLTFMKNRLEAAKQLMRDDGVMIVAIDDNEFDYLGVLLKEVFKNSETHCITIVHNPRGVQGSNFSYTHEYAFFVIPQGKKAIGNRAIDKSAVEWSSLRNWGGESLRTDAKNCFYPVYLNKQGEITGFGDVEPDDVHPDQTIKTGDGYSVYPIDRGGVERKWRYARQSVEEVAHLLRAKPTSNGYEIEIGKDFGMYKTVWVDNRYDANEYGTKLVKSLVPGCKFDFPKSLWNVYDCLYAVIQDDKDAIVLDFFAGSGTTAHAVLELNKQDGGKRRFIMAEQMDYIDDVTVPRVHNVIKNEALDADFVYCRLMDRGNKFIERVKHAESDGELEDLLAQAKKSSFLSYKVDPDKINPGDKTFKDLSLAHKKQLLAEIIDHNHLYVNYSEIDDEDYAVTPEDIKLNRQFYGK